MVGGRYMKAEDVVQLIQHYRHDLLNHLQIIHGYASMGNIKKVEEKITKIISSYDEERKLMYLQAVEFFIWVLEFPYMYEDLRLEYDIHTEKSSISRSDIHITNQCKQLMRLIQKIKHEDDLVNIQLKVSNEIHHMLKFYLAVYGLENKQQLKIHLERTSFPFSISLINETDSIACSFLVPCDEKR